jgi:hypothetical protein
MRSILALGVTAALLVALPALGQTPAPHEAAADAREELKRGFALRKQDQCADAIPHLAESFRLDPQVKALLNLADCEERVGRLVDAGGHWKQARELGEAQGNVAITREAGNRLDALERRIPHLTIVLAPGASASHVTRDGADASPGMRLPVNPGRHVIEVSQEGHETSSTQVTLAEHDDVRLEVAAGPERHAPVVNASRAEPTSSAAVAPVAEGPSAPAPVSTPAVATEDASPPARGALGYTGIGLGVVGLVGLGAGAVEYVLSRQSFDDAVTACQPNCPSPPAAKLWSQARDETNAATGLLVAGGGVAAAGIALFVIDTVRVANAVPSRRSGSTKGSRLWVAPLVGPGLRGTQVTLTW